MARVKKINSQEVGLEIGLIFFKHFLKTEYLHYGYFTPDIEVDVTNLGLAQHNYAEFLFGHLPGDVSSILDVGCGSGKTAQKLVEKGYVVEAVSPSKLLNEYARKLLDGNAPVHTKKFEDFDTDKKFDLILFSESFQYIPIEEALNNAVKFLRPGGYILIADFFQTDAPGKSALGGGHKFADWQTIIASRPELKELRATDITNETAPTIDLVNRLNSEVIHPIWKLLWRLAEDRHPNIVKFVRWKYKKKITKMENKHFTGERNGTNFKIYKKYMTYLFQLEEKGA